MIQIWKLTFRKSWTLDGQENSPYRGLKKSVVMVKVWTWTCSDFRIKYIITIPGAWMKLTVMLYKNYMNFKFLKYHMNRIYNLTMAAQPWWQQYQKSKYGAQVFSLPEPIYKALCSKNQWEGMLNLPTSSMQFDFRAKLGVFIPDNHVDLLNISIKRMVLFTPSHASQRYRCLIIMLCCSLALRGLKPSTLWN